MRLSPGIISRRWLITLFFPLFCSAQKNDWHSQQLLKWETERIATEAGIVRINDDLKRTFENLKKSEWLLSRARNENNEKAAQAADEAVRVNRETGDRQLTRLKEARQYLAQLNAVIAALKADPGRAEVLREQFDMMNNTQVWIKARDSMMALRYQEPCTFCAELGETIRTKVPPPPGPPKAFSQLQPGDVILVAREQKNLGFNMSTLINLGDRLVTGNDSSRASHTLIYLKTVNGKMLFLDNNPGEGATIITDQQYMEKYGGRSADMARYVGEPLKGDEIKKLYDAARELAVNEINKKPLFEWGPLRVKGGTTYGVKEGDLVCSEASRFALVRAIANREPSAMNPAIPETSDWFKKKILSIGYSPADFTKGEYFRIRTLLD